MPFNINEMKTNLQFGGARPNLFEVQITFPSIVPNATDVGKDARFKVTSANIPPASLGVIQVPYFGRFLKLPGDRTYPGWQVNVINDEDFKTRHALETWSNSINEFVGNKRKPGGSRGAFKTDATVIQFGKTGLPIRSYKFIGLYPTSIGEIALDWGTVDQIETFPVLWEYDYWTAAGLFSGTGNLSGSAVGDNTNTGG
jgi:hypothetical protein